MPHPTYPTPMAGMLKSALTAIGLFIAVGAFAQHEPEKEIVIINPFTHISIVSQAVGDNVRAGVLSGFADRGRFHIIDALTNGVLAKLHADQNREDQVSDANWRVENEAAYKALGATKLVIGQTNSLYFTASKSEKKHSAEVTLSLKVYNIADGAMIVSETLAVTGGNAPSEDGALNAAMKELRKEMVRFVDNHFKFETCILELGESDKGGQVKELYISGGAEMGITKKMHFNVYIERKIGPKLTKTKVGTLVSSEVLDGVTKCQVLSGEEVIKEKFNNDEKLIVIVDPDGKSSFFKRLVGA